MNSAYKNWIDYWNKDSFWRDSSIFRINAKLFLNQAENIIKFNKNDSVLDIGCGLGYLEELLAPMVKNILALDISKQFVNLCKERCKNYPNVSVALLEGDYTNLNNIIEEKSFSLFLLLSVIQYFNSIDEVKVLITSIRNIVLPGAKLFIVDLPIKRNKFGFAWDALCSLFLSIKKGYFYVLLRVAFTKLLRDFQSKSIYNHMDSLTFSRSELESLIRDSGLRGKIIKKNFSVYANRLSLLIEF